MAQIRKLCEKIIVTIVMISILLTYCATPASYAKLELEDGEFYYSGTTEGTYVATEGIFSWLINALGQVADFIVGLLTYVIRMVFVGWTAIIETLLTDTIEKTSGINMGGAALSTDPDGQVNNSDITQIGNKYAKVTVQAIVYNQVAAFDVDFFDLKVDRRYSGTGSRYYCEKNKEFCDVLFGVDIDAGDYDPNQPLSDEDKCNCRTCTAFKEHYSSKNPDGTDRKTMVEVLREKTAGWFYTIRILAAVALLLVLIFLGIKIAISTIASEKAVYKRMLVDWFVGVIIVFAIPYIMYFIIFLNKTMVNIMREATNGMTKVAVQQLNEKNSKDPSGNSIYLSDQQIEQSIYDIVKTRAYDPKLIVGSSGMLMYMALVYFAIRYTLIYLKRYFTVMILTIMAPALGASYAFQKILSGKAPSFKNWFSEYFMNVMIQTIHALIYGVFIATSLILSVQSLSGTIVAFIMMNYSLKAEKTFRKIFKFGSSNALADSTVEAGDPNQMNKNIRGALGAVVGAGALAEGFTHTPAAVAVKTAGKLAGGGVAVGIAKYQEHKAKKGGDGSGDGGENPSGDGAPENVGHDEGHAPLGSGHDFGNIGAETSKVEGAVAQTQRPTIDQVLTRGLDGNNLVLSKAINDYSANPTPENEQRVLEAAQDVGMANAFNNVPSNLSAQAKIQRIVDIHNNITYTTGRQPTSVSQALFGTIPSDLEGDKKPSALGSGIVKAQETYAKLFGVKKYNAQTGQYDTVQEGYYSTLAPLMGEVIPGGVAATLATGGLNQVALYATLSKEEKDLLKKDVIKPILAGFGGIASTFMGLGVMVASPSIGFALLATGVPKAHRMLHRNPSSKKYNGTYSFSRYGTGTVQHLAEETMARSRKEWDSQVVQNLMATHPELAESLALTGEGKASLYDPNNLRQLNTNLLTNAQLKTITGLKSSTGGSTFRNKLGNIGAYDRASGRSGWRGARLSTQRGLYRRSPGGIISGGLRAAYSGTGIAQFGEKFDLDYAKLVKKKQTQFLMDAIIVEAAAAEVTTKLDHEDMVKRVYEDEGAASRKHAEDERIALEAKRRGYIYDPESGTFRLMTKEELEKAKKEFGLKGITPIDDKELMQKITEAIKIDVTKIDASKATIGGTSASKKEKQEFLAGKAKDVVASSVSLAVLKLVQEGKLEAITSEKPITQTQMNMIMEEAGKIAKDQLISLGVTIPTMKKDGKTVDNPLFMNDLFLQEGSQQSVLEKLSGAVIEIDSAKIVAKDSSGRPLRGTMLTQTKDKATKKINESISVAITQLIKEGVITEQDIKSGEPLSQEVMDQIVQRAGEVSGEELKKLGLSIDPVEGTDSAHFLYGYLEQDKEKLGQTMIGAVTESIKLSTERTTAIQAIITPTVSRWEKVKDKRVIGQLPQLDEIVHGDAHEQFAALTENGIPESRITIPEKVTGIDRVDYVARRRQEAAEIMNQALLAAMFTMIEENQLTEENMAQIKEGKPGGEQLDRIVERAGEIARDQLEGIGISTKPGEGIDEKMYIYTLLDPEGTKKQGDRIETASKGKIAKVLETAYDYTTGHREDLEELQAMRDDAGKRFELEAEGIVESVIAAAPKTESGDPIEVSDEARAFFTEFIKEAMVMTHSEAEEKSKEGFTRSGGESGSGDIIIDISAPTVDAVIERNDTFQARRDALTEEEKGMLEAFVTAVGAREKEQTVEGFEYRKKETERKVTKLKQLMDLYEGDAIINNAVENGDGTVTLTEEAPKRTDDGQVFVVEEDGKAKIQIGTEKIVISKEVLESIPRVQKNLLEAEGINEFAARSTMKEKTEQKEAKAEDQRERIEMLKKKKEAAEINEEMTELEIALRRLEIRRGDVSADSVEAGNLDNDISATTRKLLEKSKALQMAVGEVYVKETAAKISGKAVSQVGPALNVNERYKKDIGSVISNLERLGDKGRAQKTTPQVSAGGAEWVADREVGKKKGKKLDDVLNGANTRANINDVTDGSRTYTGGDGRRNIDSNGNSTPSGTSGKKPATPDGSAEDTPGGNPLNGGESDSGSGKKG